MKAAFGSSALRLSAFTGLSCLLPIQTPAVVGGSERRKPEDGAAAFKSGQGWWCGSAGVLSAIA